MCSPPHGRTRHQARPAGIATQIANGVAKVMREQPLRGRLEELGGSLDFLPPAGFASFLVEDDRRWAEAEKAGALRGMRDS